MSQVAKIKTKITKQIDQVMKSIQKSNKAGLQQALKSYVVTNIEWAYEFLNEDFMTMNFSRVHIKMDINYLWVQQEGIK